MTEQKFKVGDKVRWVGHGDPDMGEVISADSFSVSFEWMNDDPTTFAWDEIGNSIRLSEPENDVVNHPSHYTAYKGVEIIDITEQMNFNLGNVVKYVTRAGLKSKDTEIEDLSKAKWYLEREIARLEEAK